MDLQKAFLEDEDLEVWDVREPEEFEVGHLRFAKNVPFSSLEAAVKERSSADEKLLLICATGSRSSQAQIRLSQVYGLKKVYSVRGGLAAWEALGGEVVEEKM